MAAPFAVAGFVFGRGYFAALRVGVQSYCGGGGTWRSGALMIGRLAAAVAFFTLAVHSSAWAVLGALAGFLVARTSALRARRGHTA